MNNSIVKEVSFEEIAKEFVDFVDLRGFTFNLQNGLGVSDEEQCVKHLTECVKRDSEEMHNGQVDTQLILDIGYLLFDWSETDEGLDFWCLMERCWRDFCVRDLFPIYEECELLEEEDNA